MSLELVSQINYLPKEKTQPSLIFMDTSLILDNTQIGSFHEQTTEDYFLGVKIKPVRFLVKDANNNNQRTGVCPL